MNDTLIVQQPALLEKIVDYYAAATIEKMEELRKKGKSFFGYYACQHTHHPQFVKPSNLGQSAKAGGREDAFGDAAMEMDEGVGKLLDYLRKSGLQERHLRVSRF